MAVLWIWYQLFANFHLVKGHHLGLGLILILTNNLFESHRLCSLAFFEYVHSLHHIPEASLAEIGIDYLEVLLKLLPADVSVVLSILVVYCQGCELLIGFLIFLFSA